MPDSEFPTSVEGVIALYDDVVRGVEQDARRQESEGMRAFGGAVRMSKGSLVETMAKSIIHMAWDGLGGGPGRLSFNDVRKYGVGILQEYVDRLPPDIREHVERSQKDYVYGAQVDIHAFIDGRLVLGMECKTYTENAMLKRVLADFSMLKSVHPGLKCCLLQLESQLGGDYSDLSASPTYGSKSTHTLMSFFGDVELDILTLLEGERKVDRPIHDPDYFKPLKGKNVEAAIGRIMDCLRGCL